MADDEVALPADPMLMREQLIDGVAKLMPFADPGAARAHARRVLRYVSGFLDSHPPAVVVGPDDVLVIGVSRDIPQAAAEALKARWQALVPGAKAPIVIGGVGQFAVLRLPQLAELDAHPDDEPGVDRERPVDVLAARPADVVVEPETRPDVCDICGAGEHDAHDAFAHRRAGSPEADER